MDHLSPALIQTPANASLMSSCVEDDAGLQSLFYETIALSKLPRETAISLCKRLYSPEERFAKGFYRYWRDILRMPEEEAWQATLKELDEYIQYTIDNLDDPRMQTVGFRQHGEYHPVGLYGFRALDAHPAGGKLLESMQESGLMNQYPGKKAIAHSFSALNGYRNRALLKYTFLLIALEAVNEGFEHIFFFMSDHRLGVIYRRFGLAFPKGLSFKDSKHLVGCYSLTAEHLEDIRMTMPQFQHCDVPWELPKTV